MRQFSYLATRAKALFVALVCGTEIVGYGILLTPKNLHHARVYSLAVLPKWKGMGLGRRLMQYLIEQASSLGYYSTRLEVRENNQRAIQLYKSLGFGEIGIKAKYYADGASARVMEKTLL
jgi:ribosomal-protein-alanine N-acetyltransferase